jgi:hypothetical protein
MMEIYFLARHIPFWAIPMVVLGAEFGYLFWLRKKKKQAMMALMFALFGFLCTGFYVWAGGPEKSVKVIRVLIQTHK